MRKTAAELGREIGAGKLDPVALAQSCFEAIEASGIGPQVFARLTRSRALKEAEAARKRQTEGERLGPLDGVPVSWKDLFDSKDVATESGTPLLAGRVPDRDCEVLRRATAAGMVCIGKTHMTELAFSGLGINPNTATPPNIHGAELAPGGSSSGAAASVAFGMVPIGIGSDTGGSVRIPAAWNDLTGLKTTAGLIPNDGVVPLCSGFDTVGPLCRNVEDAALMFAVLGDKAQIVPETKPLSDCRFLVSQSLTLEDCGEDQLAGFNDALEALGKAGAAELVSSPVAAFAEAMELSNPLFGFEAFNQWGVEIEANPGTMFEPVEQRFLVGKRFSRQDHDVAWAALHLIRKDYLAQVDGYDAVLAPTVPIPPPVVETLLKNIELFSSTNLLALRNTRLVNLLGLSALTLPTTRPASGILFMAAPFGEQALLSMGLSAEKAINAKAQF